MNLKPAPPLPALLWNGRSFEPCAGVPLSDRGARYGMALFESIAVREGRVEAAAAHLEQLAASCRALGWPLDEQACRAVPEALLDNYGPGPVFARLYMSAGEGGPLAPVVAPRLFLFGEVRHGSTPESLRVVTLEQPACAFAPSGDTPPFTPPCGGLKTANYWGAIRALQQAQALGGDEGLRLNSTGEVYTACMANFFIVRDGELLTPALTSGARAGTVRRWVLRGGARHVRETAIRLPELQAATECFLTSTWAGIVPASHLNSRPLATTMGERLRREWQAAILK